MFGKKEEDEDGAVAVAGGEMNGYIGKGMEIVGKVNFEGSLRVDGKLKGEVISEGTLFVGEGALVEAELNIGSVVISGDVVGVINAKRKVELQSPGKVTGDIRTPTLIIGEGVIFEGNCHMVKKGPEVKGVKEVRHLAAPGLKPVEKISS
jgi:cytoskeletal protein CcmA (bactofilin family)